MKIGVVGLGYVGLPLAVAFAEAGEHCSLRAELALNEAPNLVRM